MIDVGSTRFSTIFFFRHEPALTVRVWGDLETFMSNQTRFLGRLLMCLMVWRVSDCHIRCPSIKVLSEISLISSVSRGGWDESTDLITKQLSLAIHSIDLFTSVSLSCNSNENDQNA